MRLKATYKYKISSKTLEPRSNKKHFSTSTTCHSNIKIGSEHAQKQRHIPANLRSNLLCEQERNSTHQVFNSDSLEAFFLRWKSQLHRWSYTHDEGRDEMDDDVALS